MDRTGRALVWFSCFAVALVPLFPVRDLPLIDLPNHLAQGWMWLHWDDAAWGFRECYRLDQGPLPYVAYHGFLRWAAEVVPIHIANKIWMGLSIVGLGGATAYLLRGLGRPPLLALAALPLYWSGSTIWGFANFMASQTLLVLALALVANRHLWIGALAGAALYFVHPLGLAAWIGLAPLVARGVGPRLLVSLPAIGAFVAGMVLAPSGDLHPASGLSFAGHWPSWDDVWHDFPQLVYAFVSRDEALLLLAGVLALVLVTALLVDRPLDGERDLRPFALVAMAAFYHFGLPRNIDRPMELAGISSRFPPLLVLMLLTLPPRGILSTGRTLLLLVPLLAMNLWHGATLAGRLSRGRADELAFHDVVDRLPPRPEVLLIIEDARHPALPELHHLRMHWQALIQIERGGYDPQGWGPPFPIVATEKCKQRWPTLDLSLAQNFQWEAQGRAYQWFVVRGDAPWVLRGAPVERVAQNGAWSLWKRKD